MWKIAVLMSTYNGERYLKEQIDSILNQKDVDVTLFIRDDGSQDATQEIIMRYCKVHRNVRFCQGKRNIGVGPSFMSLVYGVSDCFDFYAFSDQDDIWYPDKLHRACEMLMKTGKSLYASNQEVTDAHGNAVKQRYADDTQIHLSPVSIVFKNMLAGCTMVFPLQFKKILCEPNRRPNAELLRVRIHDVWVASAAACTDGIVYDKEARIAYRQHENNVVGAAEETFLESLEKKCRKMSDSDKRNGRSKLAKALVNSFTDQRKFDEDLYLLSDVRKGYAKMKLILQLNTFMPYTAETKIGLLIKVLLGLF